MAGNLPKIVIVADFDIHFVRDVATHGQSWDAIFCRRRGRGLGSLCIKIDAGDGRSDFCESKRDCATDPLASTGHDRRFTCQ